MQSGFVWLSLSGQIPARWDLRLLGWALGTAPPDPDTPQLFDGRMAWRPGDWRHLPCPWRTIAVGVDCAEERAVMLAAGMADALPLDVAIGELSVRLTRLQRGAQSLPRHRRAGPLVLDLFHRDAQVEGRWLGLHPREFALLWRLAEAAGGRVDREALLADVWRLRHRPETNSLGVHVSRLRAKLATVRLAWLVETDPRGGYRIAAPATSDGYWTARPPVRRVAAN